MYPSGLLFTICNHLLNFKIVEALSYKPVGRGLNSRRFRWNFVLTDSFRPHYVSLEATEPLLRDISWVRDNEWGLWLGMTALPPSGADYLENMKPQPP